MHLWWLTNLDAPYRRPVWSALAQRMPVSVGLTADRRSPDAQGRGEDWFDHHDDRYRSITLPVRRPRVGRREVPVASSAAHRLLDDATHVVVGGWEAPVYWQLARHARRRGARVVGFYESTADSHTFRRGPVALARARWFRSLDAVVVPGAAAAAAVGSFGVPTERIHVGFNPVDVVSIADAAARARAHSPAGAPVAGHRFVYVGQLIPRKNVDTLIRAFARIATPQDSLAVVGDGSQRRRLEALSTELGAAVTFHGHLPADQVAAAMAPQHTLVLPSTEEVWGLVANEALAAGLQVVLSEQSGVAASLDGMPGVHRCPVPDEAGLTTALTTARAAWGGWIQDPPILAHTPERFAELVWSALDV